MIAALILAALTATPTTLPATLKAAQPGDTIKLAAGDYGAVTIAKRTCGKKPVTINASGARMVLVVSQSCGLRFNGGTFGPAKDTLGYAARLVQSSQVTFYQSVFTGSKRGLVIDRSTDVEVNRVRITGMTIDGINIASSQRVKVTNSRCEAFVTTGPDHPDCIQLWSRPATGITADVTISGNTSIGDMQGFTAFNHVRDGVDDGGFDRVAITGNTVEASFPQGVALYDCRDCVVAGNKTRRLPGSKYRVSVNVSRCERCRVEDNEVGL